MHRTKLTVGPSKLKNNTKQFGKGLSYVPGLSLTVLTTEIIICLLYIFLAGYSVLAPILRVAKKGLNARLGKVSLKFNVFKA